MIARIHRSSIAPAWSKSSTTPARGSAPIQRSIRKTSGRNTNALLVPSALPANLPLGSARPGPIPTIG